MTTADRANSCTLNVATHFDAEGSWSGQSLVMLKKKDGGPR